jgi:hypothetical protein
MGVEAGIDRDGAGVAEQQRVAIRRRARNRAVPMVPPAPGLLSTITCCLNASDSLAATTRAMASTPPPGG